MTSQATERILTEALPPEVESGPREPQASLLPPGEPGPAGSAAPGDPVGLPERLALETPGQANEESSGCHWETWEIGCLLCIAARAGSINHAAVQAARPLTERNESACLRKLHRLIDGACECPEVYLPELAAARKNLIPPPPRPKTSEPAVPAKVKEAYQAFETLTQQYATLSRQNQRLLELAQERRAVSLFAIAICVQSGSVHRSEVGAFLPVKVALEVNIVADEIFKGRAERRAALLGVPETGKAESLKLKAQKELDVPPAEGQIENRKSTPHPGSPLTATLPTDREIEEDNQQHDLSQPDPFEQS
jgi:hypothetical protein